ncbi:peptidase E [Streptomyces sp. RB6PN25]|uniref:Peptidase E n=1 Tax=Streptomyces humicola TaxID=2953240 RepID=A0ABT1PPM6_9ACTN|nr:Type 1 glutamine amidotransferase-like domain-containing protein [Streptomyces humicola]MCQ4079626.1 peptidase E [Streptomyces humicola]
MYLSSWRLGLRPERLLELLPDGGPAAVVPNALDAEPEPVREEGIAREVAALRGLGIDSDVLDLGDYAGRPERLADRLQHYRMMWVRGGNVFVLRHAMARSGAEAVLAEAMASDALVYSGYSAGCCVLAPSLRGLELVDDPEQVRKRFGAEPRWDGLGLLDYMIVPHHRSAHPESERIELVVRRLAGDGVAHRTLRDGEEIVVDTTS